ncbi:unnamed protein product [Mycena citricolor]|uniref:SnoaL-like domain-containing protein n=1 Tax=Mycena citricolor TaxID=2018698 RepID=A0AAD2H6X8_9AGAR|nr:unnamed protein product [Mycena citricolor]CAK5269684.1 unnamed protein product [Mycena citricolor]
MLSSLEAWSKAHISDIFEAATDDRSFRAIEATFAPDLIGTMNGSPISFADICRLVCEMRQSAPQGLSVQWVSARETLDEGSQNQNGCLEGKYIIQGILRPVDDHQWLEFERQKLVSVRIESQSPSAEVDSRRIVRLHLKASDVLVTTTNLENKSQMCTAKF